MMELFMNQREFERVIGAWSSITFSQIIIDSNSRGHELYAVSHEPNPGVRLFIISADDELRAQRYKSVMENWLHERDRHLE
ncbi:hypothetical protein CIG19_15810 [Enterobacterales bacterium CwR94]|nr:hypothetical protein CIG19_15810 [Enterobacterales bacterium CwR94]